MYVLILEGLKQVASYVLWCILITKDWHPHSLCRNEVFSVGQDRFRRFKRPCKQWCYKYQNRNKEPTRTYQRRCCKIYCSTQNCDITNDFCSNHRLKQGYAIKNFIPCGKWGRKTVEGKRCKKYLGKKIHPQATAMPLASL